MAIVQQTLQLLAFNWIKICNTGTKKCLFGFFHFFAVLYYIFFYFVKQ